ncbi:precorrin-6y C5,15-methyltransferase (decarboxylating) subunit CbiE [Segnochrobactraceae bacterium EtOH-i3]
MTAPWLTIVGIGEDGRDGLGPAALRALAQAELVAGGRRHLALAGPFSCETLAWPSPLADAFPGLLARRGRPVVVLASGDPFLHGIGATLSRLIAPEEMRVFPAPSSFSLAASRLGWPLQDVAAISLHGLAAERILPLAQPGARVLALSWDARTPALVGRLLTEAGFGDSRLTVLEALGGPRERLLSVRAAAADGLGPLADLNLIGLEIRAAPGARVLTKAPGLPDHLFEHDGQITKREIRALALSALAPAVGERLWDVGAGAGSVAIEWMLAHPANRATAIEADPERAARIGRNARAFGVPDLVLVTGRAPDALAGLPAPDAIFVGGGATAPGMIDALWQALKPGGRLVAHGVTLETEALLFHESAERGGELTRIGIARAGAVGGFRAFRPALPVTQWSVVKA